MSRFGMGGMNPQMMQMVQLAQQRRQMQQASGLAGFAPEQQQAIMAEAAQRGLGVNSSAESWQQGSDVGQLMRQQMMQQPGPMGGMMGGRPQPGFYQPNWQQQFQPIVDQYQQQAAQSAQRLPQNGGGFGGGGPGGFLRNSIAIARRGHQIRTGRGMGPGMM